MVLSFYTVRIFCNCYDIVAGTVRTVVLYARTQSVRDRVWVLPTTSAYRPVSDLLLIVLTVLFCLLVYRTARLLVFPLCIVVVAVFLAPALGVGRFD